MLSFFLIWQNLKIIYNIGEFGVDIVLTERQKFIERGKKLKMIQSIKTLVDDAMIELALKEIKFFLQEYGYDREVMLYYGKMLRRNNQVDEAIKVITDLIDNTKENAVEAYSNAAKRELFKIYFINNYYNEAYELFKDIEWNPDDPLVIQLPNVEKILKIKLGIYEDEIDNEQKIVSKHLYYDENESLEHIKEHMKEIVGEKHSVFNDIDINKIFTNVKEILPESKQIQMFSLNDIYFFYFGGIGRNRCNLLKVITVKGTTNIVSMYPTNEETREYVNDNLYLDYVSEEDLKVKKLSQIEKFNKRYSK